MDMIKEAVQVCSRRFAVWLASTLERLAGCESSDSKMLIEVEEKTEGVDDDTDGMHDDHDTVPSQLLSTAGDDMSDISDVNDTLADKVESSLADILATIDEAPAEVVSELTLAIAEMCRLAERSLMENLQNSISSSMEGDKKAHKSSHMFSLSKEPSARNIYVDKEKGISSRFHLAASRVLALYALDHGSRGGFAACENLYDIAKEGGDEIPVRPRSGVCELLESVKMASIDCSYVFGGDKRANPVPDFPDAEDDFAYPSPAIRSRKTLGMVKGLQLDVERMFSEKVATYPHPSSILEFTRDAVVAIIMKVAFKAIEEQARACTFSASGYRQLQVDVALLRHMIPHYVKDDYVCEGTNACVMLENILNDVMTTAGERCSDEEVIGNEEFSDAMDGTTKSPLDVVRIFMTNDETREGNALLFVIDD